MKNPERERHHRKRVIENRLRFIRESGWRYGLGRRGPGSLSKDHLTNCSCPACSSERVINQHRKHGRRKEKQRFARRWTHGEEE